MEFEVGLTNEDDVYRASVRRLQVEIDVPFSAHQAAYAAHLELMTRLQEAWLERELPLNSIIDAEADDFTGEYDERAAKIYAWVDEAHRWLDEAS